MTKFITLNVPRLRLHDLGGLVSVTIEIVTPHVAALYAVGAAIFQKLVTANGTFHSLMNKQYASSLTPPIKAEDRLRIALLAEVKRTAKAAQKSSRAAWAAAGAHLAAFIQPFRGIDKAPIMTRTMEINLIAERYAADPSLAPAAETLGLTTVIQALFAANAKLHALYDERLDEKATIEGPSATSIKNDVLTAYNELCTVVEITLAALPSDTLHALFNEMNMIRRKYICRTVATRAAASPAKENTAPPANG